MFLRQIPILAVMIAVTSAFAAEEKLPSLDEVLEAKRDLWGEAAMRERNGASYKFFEKLLPPPRYVNADFRHYPIVLSAPNAKVKGRIISNGSGINLHGGSRSWHDTGTAVTFRVGYDDFLFGSILNRVQHPKLAEGYLPIVQIDYEHPTPKHDNGKAAFQSAADDPGPEVYRIEAFASTDPKLVENGVIFARISLVGGATGMITAAVDLNNATFKKANAAATGQLIDAKGQTLAWFSPAWQWDREQPRVRLSPKNFGTIAICTKPMTGVSEFPVNLEVYEAQREMCANTWRELLGKGMQITTPEPVVNNAWKNLVIQNFSLINGERMNYSAGNQYQKMYAAESSDAAIPLMQWGFEEDFRRLLPVILDLVDHRLTNHFAAHKLDDIPRYYWQTRDAEFIKSMRPRWQKELDWVLQHRGGEHGLLPKDNYCTDIEVPTFSFCSNASCWADLRDLAAMLKEIGEAADAAMLTQAAAEYKKNILTAVEKNIRTETQPPFVPMSLFFDEGVHDPITETRIGSYWNLVCGYALGSGIFAGSDREACIAHYQETHGGLCMGMIRSGADSHTFWTGKHRTNPLYGMRYNIDTLRRDDVERALVSFYGMLAHGMTRNTFIGAEGCSLQPLDEGGRFFYCPPNSSSNGQWLWTLRHLLVQDFDLNNDGKPETLRLAFATPRRWLEDGQEIRLENAPTAFGRVSYKIESRLSNGEVLAQVVLPDRNQPAKTLLRVRVPEGWNVTGAEVGGTKLPVDEQGSVNISALKGKATIRFAVQKV